LLLENLKKREFRFLELISGAWEIFHKNIKTIFFINILIFFPVSLINNLVAIKMNPLMELISKASKTMDGNMEGLLDVARQVSLYNFVIILLSMIVMPLGTVAIAKTVENHLYGKEFSYKDVILFAVETGPSIIWISILSGVLIGAGTLALIIPGIFLYICWIFAEYEIALGRERGVSALQESSAVTAGRRLQIFGYAIVLNILPIYISILLNSFVPLNGDSFGICVLLDVFSFIMLSFVIVFWSVFYLNLKLVTKRFLITETQECRKRKDMMEETNDDVKEEAKGLEGEKKYPWEEKERDFFKNKED